MISAFLLMSQGLVVQPAPPDLSVLQAAVAAAQADAATALSKANAAAQPADVSAAITAATPTPCPVPPVDTLNGSAGSLPTCMTRQDTTRPAAVQAKVTTTATDAGWAVTFDRAFPSPPSYVDARVYGQAQPYLCTVINISATGADGKCYQLVATTLPSVITAAAGTVVSPFQAAGGGISVRVAAKQ
jgi:hypothetical protein